MKLFSILNKPANKASNKQAGIVFLEYVIMAFIVTVAVICALWWFYWHLQQMTWEIKAKLDTMRTSLTCPLGKPWGTQGDQPTPGGNGNGNGDTIGPTQLFLQGHVAVDVGGTVGASQTITLTNNTPGPPGLPGSGDIYLQVIYDNGTTTDPTIYNLNNVTPSVSFPINQTVAAGDGLYHVEVIGMPFDTTTWPLDITVQVTSP